MLKNVMMVFFTPCVKVEGFSGKLSQYILILKLKFVCDFLAGTLTSYILT